MSVEGAVTGQTIQATVTQGAMVEATMGNSASVSGQPGMPVIRYVKDADLYSAIDGYMDEHPEIPAPTFAAIGQTIRVTAVDEDGKPTAWEAADFPGQTVDKEIAPEFLPLASDKTRGAVLAQILGDSVVSYYTPCGIDANGNLYSMKYEPAQIFSELSVAKLIGLLNVGDHAIFTDSIADEVCAVASLTLPVHAWYVSYGRSKKYLLESADGLKVALELYLGKIISSSVLAEPSSGGSLIVTYRSDDSAYATHNSAEIYEAFQSGKTVQFYDGSNCYVYQLVWCSDSRAEFSVFEIYEGEIWVNGLAIDGDGFINWQCDDWIKLYPMDSMLLNSSTEGSSKQFQITVDDTGTISATEISTEPSPEDGPQ